MLAQGLDQAAADAEVRARQQAADLRPIEQRGQKLGSNVALEQAITVLRERRAVPDRIIDAKAHEPAEQEVEVEALHQTYNKACEQADGLLFSLGNLETVNVSCRTSGTGKLMPNALYVHESALEQLSAVLRLFEGCARGYIGRVEGANIIKLHRHEPKISYLSYPDFETHPHPALAHSLTVHFQTFRVKSRSSRQYRNPPILHRKETFLHAEHPLHAKFARLSWSEENNGLYDDPSQIGTREGWERLLLRRGFRLQGHRLLRGQH